MSIVTPLEFARHLIDLGMPVFVGTPCRACAGTGCGAMSCAGGYIMPTGYQKFTADLARIAAYRTGVDCLCAVTGVVFDVLDTDTQHGGEVARANLITPPAHITIGTPSGGSHEYVAPLGIGSHIGFMPGLDLKGGRPDGTGRGFVFLPGTDKVSKTTGLIGTYTVRSLTPGLPVPDALHGLLTEQIVACVVKAPAPREPRQPGALPLVGTKEREGIGTPIPHGSHDRTLLKFAARFPGLATEWHDALALIEARFEDCVPPWSGPASIETRANQFLQTAFAKFGGTFDDVFADTYMGPRLLGGDPGWAASQPRARTASPTTQETPPEAQDDDLIPLDWDEVFTGENIVEWLVDGFLPLRRATALYSAPKLGKSLLLLELAVAVANGTEFLGMATTTGVVLYIDHENDPRGDIRDRLESMGYGPKDLGNLRYYSFPVMAPLDTAAGGATLMKLVTTHTPCLVVIDTVSRTIEGEENSNDTWLGYNRYTGVLMKRAGITSVRLDHSGKDETKGQRGGSAKSGDVDAIWQLLGDPETQKFTLKLDGGRVRYPTDQIGFTRDKDPLRSIRDDSGQKRSDGKFHSDIAKRQAVQTQLLKALSAHPDGLTAGQLQAQITVKAAVGFIVNVRKDLQAAGGIQAVKDGRSTTFTLTANGRKVLDGTPGTGT